MKHTPKPCGCKVTAIPGNFLCKAVIQYCPIHSAAPELLNGCQLAIRELHDAAAFGNHKSGSNAGIWETLARELESLVAKATGGKP